VALSALAGIAVAAKRRIPSRRAAAVPDSSPRPLVSVDYTVPPQPIAEVEPPQLPPVAQDASALMKWPREAPAVVERPVAVPVAPMPSLAPAPAGIAAPPSALARVRIAAPAPAPAPAPARTTAPAAASAPARVTASPEPRPPVTTLPRRSRIALRARGAAWSIGVLLVSVIVGLVLAAALSHNSTPSNRFSALASIRPGRFIAADAISHKQLPRGASLDAYVNADRIAVYARPNGHLRHHELDALTVNGKPVPLVLLVERRKPGWLKVELPVRPNLSTGWVHAGDVSLHSNLFHLQAQLTIHRLTVWSGTRVIMRVPIGVGLSVSPTPSGRYYIVDLLRPPVTTGLYGPYAFGLSAHSDVYTTFAGGNGQVGLHGTDDPAGIGTNVSHGCIRVSNANITRLAKLLPIGTPITIVRSPATVPPQVPLSRLPARVRRLIASIPAVHH
jgi:hypothetical protein